MILVSATPANDVQELALKRPLHQNGTFLSVLIGHAISALGDGFHSVALSLWVLQRTGSSAAMAYILAARILAMILLGPFAGTFCDRTDRRRLMLTMDIVRVGLVGWLLVAMTAAEIHLSLVVLLTFLVSAAGAFFQPAFSASLIQIVSKEQVVRATSLLQLTDTIAQVAGPLLGGLVMVLAGPHLAMGADGLSFLLSGAALVLVRFPSPRLEGGTKRPFFTDMREGFTYLLGQPVVLGVMLMGPAFSLFGAAHAVAMPIIAVRLWHVSGFEFGLLEIAWPIGMGVVAALIALPRRIPYRGLLIALSFSLAGIADMVAPLTGNIYPAVVLLIIGALFSGFGIITVRVLMRTMVPPEMQGRVFGLYGSVANAAWPVGAICAGLLSDRFSPIGLGVIFGAGFLLTGLLGLLNQSLRDFR